MSLSTLIVQREIASIREVEEALARQVLYGGDFVTNLLEVCRLDEAQLLPLVAESLGLPPAPPGELPRPEAEAKRLVAAEVAVERNLAPLTVDRYGLVVAVSSPLSADVEQELSFALALPISQKISSLVRIKQALARDYGVALDRRTERLLHRMTTDGPRAASELPPMRGADLRMGAPRPPSIAPSPNVRPAASVPAPGPRGTLVRKTEVPPARPLRRRRGAITVDVARSELEEAGERDTIFDLVFEFARQYFDYTAAFIVHGEIAEGRDAFGDGAARDKVARIGVPLDLPSILSAARDKKATIQKVPSAEGLDVVLMHDLARSGKSVCVVLPIVVRTRVVALLLGDGGDTGIDRETLADVEGCVANATAAFERLIVRRKLKGTVPPLGLGESAPPPAVSIAPMTKISELSDRPSIEELAPPIRDLMMEPMSRAGQTVRDPVVEAFVPLDSGFGPPIGSNPPPPNMLAVRRPSGRPIPREEPEPGAPPAPAPAPRRPAPTVTSSGLAAHVATAVSATSALSASSGSSGSSSSIAAAAASGTSASGSSSSLAAVPGAPRARGRREAPKLEFGASPSVSSSFGADTFGTDEVQLLREIHGGGIDVEPATSRDLVPPVASMNVAAAPTPAVTPTSLASPKAESPPPDDPVRRIAVTDVSPVALPSLPPSSAEMVSADDLDVSVVDPDATPIAPAVYMDKTPVAPPVSEGVGAWGSAPDDVVNPWARAPSAPPVLPAPGTPRLRQRAPVPPVPASRPPMPQSEQQISVAAHRPPSSRNDVTRALPSVIVDVASEYVGLVERVIAGADASDDHDPARTVDDAEVELLRAGGHAMPAIMARFPGPVTMDRERLFEGPLPRVAECGPVLRLVASQRRTALPFVLSHVEDADREHRFWATFLLTELVYPDVLDPVLARVFDEDSLVRRAARAAARAFAELYAQTIVERLELIAMDGSERAERRILAIEAMGETRVALAIPALVRLLGDPEGEIRLAVRSALTMIARQDFGVASEKWEAWWTQNKERHRLEWLIDALMNEQAALRAAASEELKTTTKEYFGYYDDLPKRERERAQSRYREWWNTIGRIRFGQTSTRG